jgi:integrase
VGCVLSITAEAISLAETNNRWERFSSQRSLNLTPIYPNFLLAHHDLRRTCARLCHEAGGELEQIQFLFDHASVQTTEWYIGCRQNLREAVNDRFRISPSNNAAYEV